MNGHQSSSTVTSRPSSSESRAVDYVVITHLHVDHVSWNTIRSGDR
jgi:L-ascorbate metabolism protein UlaG (beta-lactamase superfamily)